MKNLFSIFILICYSFAMILTGCNKENFVEEFEVSTNQLHAGNKAETLQFTLKSNVDWIITDNAEWVSLSALAGSGTTDILVTVAENPYLELRDANIKVVVNGAVRQNIKITQTGDIMLSPSEKTVKNRGEVFTISVEANLPWTLSSDSEWCSVGSSSGSASEEVTVTAQPNPGLERTAVITLLEAAGNNAKTLTVTQMAAFTRTSDSLALVDFYNATDGANWKKNNWDLNSPINTWSGIKIDNASNRVTEITIGSNTIVAGTVPESIGNLDKLTKLSLGSCNLSGALPESIYELTELKNLVLNTNAKLQGNITKLMQSFKQLEIFNVMNNALFTGTIPDEIGSLLNLNTLYLSQTGVTGTIPASIGNCTKLKIFGATKTKLTGSIPDVFYKFTTLQLLQLNDCDLSGALPKSLGSMNTTMSSVSIWFHNNNLTGNIPEEWANITTKCGQLRIQGNKLSGVVPAAVQSHANYTSKWNPKSYIYPQQTGYGLSAN